MAITGVNQELRQIKIDFLPETDSIEIEDAVEKLRRANIAGVTKVAREGTSILISLDGKREGIHGSILSLLGGQEGSVLAADTLGVDQEKMLEAVRDFLTTELPSKKVKQMDQEARLDPQIVVQMQKLGLMSIEIPEEYGGSGMSFRLSILIIEELAKVDPSVALLSDVQNTLFINAILKHGTIEQKQELLPNLATNGYVGAFALTEGTPGSDAAAIQTTAKKEGDDWVLNGAKQWITNAGEAKEKGYFIVFASTDKEKGYKGISAFIVPYDTPGLSLGDKVDKSGIRASSTYPVELTNVRIPVGNMLGDEGRGFNIAMETLNEGRIGIAAQGLGLAKGCLEHAMRYVSNREDSRGPLMRYQKIQSQLAQLEALIKEAETLTYNAAHLKEAGRAFAHEAAIAKIVASQTAQVVARECMNLCGAQGFETGFIEKMLRDSGILTIYEGTSNIMEIVIFAQMLKKYPKLCDNYLQWLKTKREQTQEEKELLAWAREERVRKRGAAD